MIEKTGPLYLQRLVQMLCICAPLLWLAGCTGVTVGKISSSDYLADRRNDILTTGRLGQQSVSTLIRIGFRTQYQCTNYIDACRNRVSESDQVSDEERLSLLSELWVYDAIHSEETEPGVDKSILVDKWLNAARSAYGYLFFTQRDPEERAFEDRQTQVRDYYNYATQRTFLLMFDIRKEAGFETDQAVWAKRAIKGWQVLVDMTDIHLPPESDVPEDLIAAGSLTFSGIEHIYRRDGLGSELVVVGRAPQGRKVSGLPFEQTSYPVVTGVIEFSGRSLEEVMGNNKAVLRLLDPYRSAKLSLAGKDVPFAGNFTSGYGLWLARGDFTRQSWRSFFGLEGGIDEPRIIMMQPYDPDRRVILMLHGLVSGPAAWVNTANDILGDSRLRRSYQVWQVYYPTNVPIVVTHAEIRRVLRDTLDVLDPTRTAQASKDMTIIGHSMGGILARLMVSESGDTFWDAIQKKYSLDEEHFERLQNDFADYLHFSPIKEIDDAIFIATPHSGTPEADTTLSRWMSKLISLPTNMVSQLKMQSHIATLNDQQREVINMIVDEWGTANSLTSLSTYNQFLLLAADIPISPTVRYHSIIGVTEPDVPLFAADDGYVPYVSAHIEGADSETVVTSSHSVQASTEAINVIRAILAEKVRRNSGSGH
ncbi:esterase/lipase family protein [Thalassospira profundimaris]|uniref:esterase/lipase family protein n=1 Tax=Thalassospira profundimaris TaxID=502049 RepID=UPI00031AFF9F|nr:alpha/beta hydrolase [Thalassospira profundimaris]